MNKMLKKIISVALAMAMVVTTVYVGNPTTAQAKQLSLRRQLL